MQNYNFNEVVDRTNTNSVKFDFATQKGYKKDILPFWIADMDLKVSNEIKESLIGAVEHGIFGYSDTKSDYNNSIINWFKNHFDYELKSDWLVTTPGVVFAICTAIKAFTNIGDSIIIQRPVYNPFSSSILNNDRKLINSPLIYKNGKYEIDFIDFENKIVENNVKMYILCSPHNPIGKVYKKEELQKLGDICLKHGVLIISDEIHCDFARKGIKHHLMLSVCDKFLNNTILLTAPSKTFNIAGLQVSNIFIPNEKLRLKFTKEVDKCGYHRLNALGIVATKTAYQHGEMWFLQLKEHLENNRLLIDDFLKINLPKVKLVQSDGTFLAWLDFSQLGLSHEQINNITINDANLWLDEGTMFGDEGTYFQRINFACSTPYLQKGLDNLYKAFKKY